MVHEIKKVLQTHFSKEDNEINNSILDMVDEVCEKEISVETAREMDQFGTKLENGNVIVHPNMKNIVDTFIKNDLMGLACSEQYDGSGLTYTLQNAVIERVARADASASIYLSLQGTIIDYIQKFGTEEAKQKYLPDLAKGNRLAGLLLTEPGAGSDLGAVKTKAVRDGDEYIINGEKIFITHSGIADTFLFIAATEPSKSSRGLTAFALDTKNQPGFNTIRLEHKLGIKASPTGVVFLDNVRIPVENRLGEENRGFSVVLYGLASSRIGIAAQATGISDAAYRKAIHYANERVQFGQPLLKYQASQFKVADMATMIHMARNYYLYSSILKDRDEDFSRESSIAKLYASEMAQKVTYEAIQMHGGYGYIVEYDVERYYRDARITTLYEGTSEVQRLITARDEINRHTG
ncbi:MAG: acyl-CoA dehydrogenase family protein [Candidatus Hodarchaeales archaeon]